MYIVIAWHNIGSVDSVKASTILDATRIMRVLKLFYPSSVVFFQYLPVAR